MSTTEAHKSNVIDNSSENKIQTLKNIITSSTNLQDFLNSKNITPKKISNIQNETGAFKPYYNSSFKKKYLNNDDYYYHNMRNPKYAQNKSLNTYKNNPNKSALTNIHLSKQNISPGIIDYEVIKNQNKKITNKQEILKNAQINSTV